MKKEYSFQELNRLTKDIFREFEKVEGKPWRAEGCMIELSKQLGDLSKRVMVYEKYYFPNRKGYETTKEDIGDELADLMFSIIRLAEHYDIDLEEAFLEARRNELKSLGKKPNF